MPNNFSPKCSPIWGFPPHFSIADLPTISAISKQILQTAVDVTSAAVDMFARGIEISCDFGDVLYTCDLDLLSSVGGTDTLVLTFKSINALKAQNMFAGNLEFVDLQGYSIKLRTRNTVNPNSVLATFSARPTY